MREIGDVVQGRVDDLLDLGIDGCLDGTLGLLLLRFGCLLCVETVGEIVSPDCRQCLLCSVRGVRDDSQSALTKAPSAPSSACL